MSSKDREFGRILKEGFLVKKGHVRTNWRTRWFKLRRDSLSYYKQRSDASPISTIMLEGCSVNRPTDETVRHPHRFELKTPAGRSYFLEAASSADVEGWTTAIAEAAQSRTALRRHVSVKQRHISVSQHLEHTAGGASSTELMEAMQDMNAGIKLDTHILPSGKVYHLCFCGIQMVDWLMEWSFAESREGACAIGLSLLNGGQIQPMDGLLVDAEEFLDSSDALYRFVALHVTNRGGTLPFDPCSPVKSLSPMAMSSDSEDSSEDEADESVEADLAALGLNNRQVSPGFVRFEIKQGILSKRGHKRKNWKARRFVLMADGMYYYRASKPQSDPIGRIPLKGASVSILDDRRASTSSFRRSLQTGPVFTVATANGIEFFLQAANSDEREDWMDAIEKCITRQREKQRDSLASS
ncbi:pleckstrin-2-like [Sycon ciliatum]|uniref:pleckstrin-2-like n=1 Tax=Sycon ciliatum TaxID=27933 RepID=UPI0020AD424F|eukprot:scpid59697/ scgid10872/ Pleckstrin-2